MYNGRYVKHTFCPCDILLLWTEMFVSPPNPHHMHMLKPCPTMCVLCSALHHVRTQEVSGLQPGREPSPEPKPDFGLPASTTMRNKFVVHNPPSFWFFVIAAQAD